MRNVATILPLKSKLSRKFQRFSGTDGSIEMLKKIVEFPNISIKMKYFKTFCEAQIASRFIELFSPPPDKSFLHLWNINFLTEIYRNMQTFAFQMLVECSSRTFRNDAVQMFFSDSNQKHLFYKNFKGSKVFGCVAGVYLLRYLMFSELRYEKLVRFFE